MSGEVPSYHWKVGAVPLAATVKVTEFPGSMVAETGWAVISGGVITVAVAVIELTADAALEARTQKLVVSVRAAVVKVAEVASGTGFAVTPEAP